MNAFDASKVTITRKRFSTTQGEVLIEYDGVRIEQYGDKIEFRDGKYAGYDDAFWIDVAKRETLVRGIAAEPVTKVSEQKAYLVCADHGLTEEQADEIVRTSSEMCVKRRTIRPGDSEWYVVYLSRVPQSAGQKSFHLSLNEDRKFFDPLKWTREYWIHVRFGKIEFAQMALTGSGSSFEITDAATIGL